MKKACFAKGTKTIISSMFVQGFDQTWFKINFFAYLQLNLSHFVEISNHEEKIVSDFLVSI